MRRMAQRTVFRINLPNLADQPTWDRFVARAHEDGVTLGDLFRALIYGYAAGERSIPVPPQKKKPRD